MRHARSLLATGSALLLLTPALGARADTTPQTLPFTQNWTDTGQIATSDDWSRVSGVIGYRGDSLVSTSGVDPQTVTADGSSTPVDVNANQTNPNTFSTGGVTEFEVTNPVVALTGSTTADAPHLVFTISTIGRTDIVFACNLRDVDGSMDNSVQPIAVQYRVGMSGAYTNLPAGYVADASSGPSLATLETPVNVTLPAAADNQAVVQIRVITTDASGADEWIGIDDISITGTTPGAVCGNGIVEPAGEESCDDGNTNDGDCCSSSCFVESPDTVCRAAVSECDVEETCGGDGESPVTCPADASQPAGTSCGGSVKGGPPLISCDLPDTCSGGVGASAFCVDNVEPSTTICRAAIDQCDAPEFCDGTSSFCPVTDAAQPPGTPCNGAPSGVCDAQDVCSGTVGSTASCQPRVQPNTTVCRAAGGACDVEERCNGVGTSCPMDVFRGSSTVCRPVAGTCDSAELCTGSSAACPSDSVLPIGTSCRPSTGVCDPAETCNGFAACPSDRTAADGTACSDGTACNGAETCQSGRCAMGTAPSCDDMNACTADMCAEPGGCRSTPTPGCCNIDGDCADDGDVCTLERCSGTGGRCTSLRIDGCCTSDSQCGGGSACLAVSCNRTTNRCETNPVMGCCDSDSDCDDSLVCTRDTCNVATGACTNAAVVGCCVGDGDCDDGDECSMDRCNIEGGALSGSCGAMPIPGCCLGDMDCMDADGSSCTTPACNAMTQRCIESAVDCDDMDACTVDACEVDGSCSHTPLSCDDSNACTADSCSAGICEHMDLDGCMADAGMMMGEDAGVIGEDAAMGGLDAALPDAGFTNDAASLRTDVPVDTGPLDRVDAGIGMNDAGPLDLPTLEMNDCSCRAVGADNRSRSPLAWLALGALGLALVGRRRARSASSLR